MRTGSGGELISALVGGNQGCSSYNFENGELSEKNNDTNEWKEDLVSGVSGFFLVC